MKKKHLLYLVIIGCLVVTGFYWNRHFEYVAVSTLNGYSKEPPEKVIKLLERSDLFAFLVFDKRRRNGILMDNAIIRHKVYYCDGKSEAADLEYTKIRNYTSIALACDSNKVLIQEEVESPKSVKQEQFLNLARAYEERDKRYLFNISPEGLKQQKEGEEELKKVLKELKNK
ncbi:MAG: hypothetical protein WCJ02_05010 [bacterium]